MGSLQLPHVVWLSATDRAAIDRFTRNRGTLWSEAVEVMVRQDVANALEAGTRQALGVWEGTDLAGVAVFFRLALVESNYRLQFLATSVSGSGRGHAKDLLESVLAYTKQEGCTRVSGVVHIGNP